MHEFFLQGQAPEIPVLRAAFAVIFLSVLLGFALAWFLSRPVRQRLLGETNTLHALFSSMIDGLIVLDGRHRVRFLNPVAERALRVHSGESFGKTLDVVWPLKEVQDLVSQGISASTVVSREISLPYNILKLYVVPMSPVAGASAMLIFRDITEFRQLEETRNQFISQVSHELRTPLTIMKGFVVTLLDDPKLVDYTDVKKILLRMEKEADRLTKLVEELLELSRLRGGRSPLTYVPVSIRELASDTVEGFRSHAGRYNISIQYRDDNQIPMVLGDVSKIKQVLLNLMDNAVKYSPSGGKVEVELSRCPEGVSLKVSDQGSGIPANDLPHVFKRFFRGEKKEAGKGWGLGLPIVKEIVDAHNGRILIESKEKQGTTVVVILPAEGLPIQKAN